MSMTRKTSSPCTDVVASTPAGEWPDAAHQVPVSPKAARRLLPSLGLTSLVAFGALNALMLVLLPNQIAGIDPAAKVANLALANASTLVFALLTQPIVGALSDRTRSRLGRRTPWLLFGAVVAASAFFVLGSLDTVGGVILALVLIQVGLNALIGPLTAIVPDRFPQSRRGVPSALVGFGTLLGAAGGATAAGQMSGNLPRGYSILGIALLAATTLFVLVNRDRPSTALVRSHFNLRGFLSDFWVSPQKNRDFAWAFAARFVFYLGFFSYLTMSTYVLTDYVGLPLSAASAQVGFNALISLPGMVLGLVFAGWLSDRTGRRKPFIYLASAFVMVSLAVPLAAPTVQGVMISSVLNGIGFGLYLSCDTALLTGVLPRGGAAAGKDLGILNIATALPQALGSVVASVVILHAGGYPGLLVFGIVCIGIATLLLVPIKTVR